MRKNLVVCVCLFIITVPVFGQAIDKSQYNAIDPFDYKLEEDKPPPRSRITRYFKSVVEFVSEIRSEDNTINYKFISLDKRTSLILKPNPESNLKPPSPGQTVTIYYTMEKLRSVSVVLDAFEDNRNKDEKGIGVVKSPISSSNIRKSDYKLITPDDYKDNAFFTLEDDEDVRKFYVIVNFESQDGIFFQFTTPENAGEKLVFLKKKWAVQRRYPVFTTGQKMTVYFTATKQANDHLKIDDIVVMN